jgi:hypothetical protein
MRILFGVAIIALLLDGAAFGQSLAEAARTERARRQSSSEVSVVYTNESLGASGGILETPRPSAEESDEEGILTRIGRLQAELGDPGLDDEGRTRLEAELVQARVELGEAAMRASEAGETEETPDRAAGDVDEAAAAPATSGATLRLDRQAAIADQAALVQSLEDQEVSQSLEIGRLRARLTAPTGSQRERNLTQTALGEALGRLGSIQAALEGARAELERLQAEGPAER